MSAIVSTWKIWAPILLAILPSLIVGFSKSPKTQKIGDVLKWVLQFLSVVTPKDEPGTFKMPLKAVRPLPPKAPEPDTGSTNGPSYPQKVAVGLLVIGMLSSGPAVGLSGCATFKNAEGGVVDCGIASIRSDSASLIPTIYAILTGGAVNWAQQLDSLKSLGEDALACALAVVGQQLQNDSTPQVDPSAGPAVALKANEKAAKAKAGLSKAQKYSLTNHYQTKNVEAGAS